MLAVLAMPHLVVQAQQERGYFAIGGEWLLLPLVLLVLYGLQPTVITLVDECLKSEKEKAYSDGNQK